MQPRSSIEEAVVALVAPVVEAAGCTLFDVIHKPGVLRIALDRPGGIDLEVIGEVSPLVSDVLDGADPLQGRYTLEVSSPGLERPLRTPAQVRASVGSVVAVKTGPEVEGERRVKGLLESADEEGLVVAGRRLSYDDVVDAHTVFEWGAAEKPATAQKGAKAAWSPKPKGAPKRAAAAPPPTPDAPTPAAQPGGPTEEPTP